jgi:hypothetical protein
VDDCKQVISPYRCSQQWHVSVAAAAPASDAGFPSGVMASRESNTM